jgi:hypothetical protein
LKNSDCNPAIYLLEPLDPSASNETPFSTTALPLSSPHANRVPGRIALQKIQRPGLVFESVVPLEKVTADQYRSLFDSSGVFIDKEGFPMFFYNKDVALEVIDDLWKLLMSPDHAAAAAADLQKYRDVKRQWRATTVRQWRNHPELRHIVSLLEQDLVDHKELFAHFARPACVQRIAFNVLLTLSLWNWDGSSYVKGLITFLSPFLDSFIKEAGRSEVIAHSGRTVEVEAAESEIFWCFAEFYDRNQLCDLVRPSRQPLLKPLFIAVGDFLAESFPDLLQLLHQKHAFSLDFLREDCSKWFTTCFDGADIRRLWISVLTFPSSIEFFQCFIVSLLFSLTPSLVEMNPMNNDEFVERFHELKKKVSLNLLLQNAAGIMELLHRGAQGK